MINQETKTRTSKIGKLPVVVLPLSDYDKIKEDLAILQSKTLRNKIATARKEKRVYSALEVKKILGL